MRSNLLHRYVFLVFLSSLILAACSGQAMITAWIDVPLDGLLFTELRPVNIQGHASSLNPVSRVEILVNGTLVAALDSPPMEGNLARFQALWTPSEHGSYVIQAVAYGEDGQPGQPHSVTIRFLTPDEAAALVPTTEPSPTELSPTETPETITATPAANVRFWADPSEIQAGSCATLYWQAENVSSVVFGGRQQPLQGSSQSCLCVGQRYTLTINHLDGSQETQSLDIAVTGTCVTPTQADTTPPPAPAPFVPADNLSLTCRASQDLGWLPVEDPSGIAEYQVQVQRHAGDNQWQDVPGSVFSRLTDKQTTIAVECAWYYRWRVRAVDGAGNIGPWSAWFRFAITIG